MTQLIPKVFVAYPYQPRSIGETINLAINDLKQSGIIEAVTWEELNITGNVIIQQILTQIDESKVLCVDLTGLNFNAMFELGYGIAKNKYIFPLLDNSFTESRNNFEQLRILTTMGYLSYINSSQIQTIFYKEITALDKKPTFFEQDIKPNLEFDVEDKILYLKSKIDTDASVQISRRLEKSSISLTIDDPNEISLQYLSWYGKNIASALGVVCHFLNPQRDGALLHNAKYALIAGMSVGMGKTLLMLSEGIQLAPLDYRELLLNYSTAKEAVGSLNDWLEPIEANWLENKSKQNSHIATLKLANELKNLKVGEPIAENEIENLVDYYFVETSSYIEARDGLQTVFVGRKGTGKSANYYKLSDELSSDKRNLVVCIKPISYELLGVNNLLEQFHEKASKNYTIESLWKFLLLSEIGNTIIQQIKERPFGDTQTSEDETELLELFNSNNGTLGKDFAIRLERSINSIHSNTQIFSKQQNLEANQNAITEAIHKGIYKQLRIVIGKLISNKQRIIILIDNLDKAWDKNRDLALVADFFLGLLSASQRLSQDFKRDDSRRDSAVINVVIFLRSDIFYKIKSIAREPDKISGYGLTWDDRELLLRVVEERFIALHQGNLRPDEIWTRYFCDSVRGVPVQDYFLEKCLPRPRDVLYFIKAAIANAVNRRHSKVEENDVLDGEKQYSQFAIESLLVEGDTANFPLESIIYELVGASSYLSERDVEDILSRLGKSLIETNKVIEELCKLRFFGIQINEDDYRFTDDEQELRKNKILAQKFKERNNKDSLLMINPVYWAFLEIQ